MSLAALVRDLRAEAARADERRLLVLAGDRDAGIDAAYDVVEAAAVPRDGVTLVTAREGFRYERVHPKHAARLLGTTREIVVLDAHEDFSPNALGRVVGTVRGGGLLVLLTPPLDEWPDRRDSFDEHLAVPPFGVDDVTGRFRRRLVGTLRQHPGVAIYDADGRRVERDGLTGADSAVSDPAARGSSPAVPADGGFPRSSYDSCLTADQARAVRALERLRSPGSAVVVEADRGRGKSSAAGIAAAALALDGRDVLVTASERRNASEVFARARELLKAEGAVGAESGESDARSGTGDGPALETTRGGRIRFAAPAVAADLTESSEIAVSSGAPDVILVDEAAALPVRLLRRFLAAPAVAFFTTVHGYEGAGRGFSVRFRDALDESDHTVANVRLDEPIRYARGDPVEAWAFRALLLDARPAVDPLVAEATPETVEYRALAPDDLLADEHLLREAFGLLVLAHYRTEPDDLARLLDAPNIALRALTFEGRVASIALLAREGGLDAETRRSMYDGSRVRGNMLPDVFTSQLRDEDAGLTVGHRVMRIATHHAIRSTGLGSRLLAEIEAEFRDEVDWLGVGYGATPELLSFWERNGYRTVHLSTTRNDASGEYSALMLRPLSAAGDDLRERHGRWFLDRIRDLLSDPLRDLDPDVAREALRAVGAVGARDSRHGLRLPERDWQVVASAAYGPGLYTTALGAFRDLALAHLAERSVDLDPRAERLLVRKVLQGRPWTAVADELGYVSRAECMRALGRAYRPLVERYGSGSDAAAAERRRYER